MACNQSNEYTSYLTTLSEIRDLAETVRDYVLVIMVLLIVVVSVPVLYGFLGMKRPSLMGNERYD